LSIVLGHLVDSSFLRIDGFVFVLLAFVMTLLFSKLGFSEGVQLGQSSFQFPFRMFEMSLSSLLILKLSLGSERHFAIFMGLKLISLSRIF